MAFPWAEAIGLVGSAIAKPKLNDPQKLARDQAQAGRGNLRTAQGFLPQYFAQLGLDYNPTGGEVYRPATPATGMVGHPGYSPGTPAGYESHGSGDASLRYSQHFDPFTQSQAGQNFMASQGPIMQRMAQLQGVGSEQGRMSGHGGRGEGPTVVAANLARQLAASRRDWYGSSFLPQQQQAAGGFAGLALPGGGAQAVPDAGAQNQGAIQQLAGFIHALQMSRHGGGGGGRVSGGGTYQPAAGDPYGSQPGVVPMPGYGQPWDSNGLPEDPFGSQLPGYYTGGGWNYGYDNPHAALGGG